EVRVGTRLGLPHLRLLAAQLQDPTQVLLFRRPAAGCERSRGADRPGFRELRFAVPAFPRLGGIDRIADRTEDGLNGPLERLVAATVTFASAPPRSSGYEFMYPPIIATASSRRAHATTTKGASAMCFAFVQAPASFRFVSSSETTMNFHGWRFSAEWANRAAF